MKEAILLLAITTAFSTPAQTILYDDFNGSAIDSARWQTVLPFNDSSVTQTAGNAVIANKGWLLSATSFPATLDITGRFEFTGNVHDQFKIVTRANGTFSENPFGEVDRGIGFEFWMMNDSGSTDNNIKIVRNSNPQPTPILAIGTYPISLDTFYDFRVTDDGDNVALYISDFAHPFLAAHDSSLFGDRLAIYNREGSGGGSTISEGSIARLDFLSVTTIPEPSSALLIGFAAVFGSLARVKKFVSGAGRD